MSTTIAGDRKPKKTEKAGGSPDSTARLASAPPKMNRSVGQLASSYAPMRHFAFENGLGVCMSVPVNAREAELGGNTPEQIHRRLKEAAQTWFERGFEHVERASAANAEAFRHLLVDDSLYDRSNKTFEYRRDAIGFVEPRELGYEVAPTTLICGACGLLQPCESASKMADFLDKAEKTCMDPAPTRRDAERCRWRQFEPIFVHPSGAWRSVDVSAFDIFPGSTEPSRRSSSCEACGHRQFKVDTTKVTLSGWFLKCAKCDVRTSWTWTDNDKDYLQALRSSSSANGSGPDPDSARMEKISYGAAIAFLPQSESFIDLPASGRLDLIEGHRFEDLCAFIAESSGWTADPPTPAEAADELERGGENARAIASRIRLNLSAATALRAANSEMAAQLEAQAVAAVDEALSARLIPRRSTLPNPIRLDIRDRSARWASRYDPFQLSVEHAALDETKLQARMEGARRSFVRFTAPDYGLRSFEDGGSEAAEATERVKQALDILGIEEAGLIPKFELCRFTYGYSRTSSGPIHPNRPVPVRLKLFPQVQIAKERRHPVYVLRQKNEAFYFRLDQDRVRAWLEQLGCEDGHLLAASPSLRAALLTSAHPMDRFLTEHDRDRDRHPRLYAATYSLVHTMAHHVIRTMARLSGLDEGGLGEYLFPTDLAFVVYRSGMTMDLGDLSSLWRNSWEEFLRELCDHPNSLGCNVGSLCSEQGGACPDCVMIPEVTCVAGNRYLSRSLLTGEGPPGFMDLGGRPTPGYLHARRGTDHAD